MITFHGPHGDEERLEIEHDTVISEVWATDVWGTRGRVRIYRGDTKEHINWKLNEYKDHHPELVVPGEDELAELLG